MIIRIFLLRIDAMDASKKGLFATVVATRIQRMTYFMPVIKFRVSNMEAQG